MDLDIILNVTPKVGILTCLFTHTRLLKAHIKLLEAHTRLLDARTRLLQKYPLF